MYRIDTGLGFAVQPGTSMVMLYHKVVCVIEVTPGVKTAVKFIAAGLNCNEVCLVCGSPEKEKEGMFRTLLSAQSVDVSKAIEKKDLVIISDKDAVLKNGKFDPDHAVGLVKGFIKQAGNRHVRMLCDMTWLLENTPGRERVFEFESKCAELVNLPHQKVLTLSAYDEVTLDPDQIDTLQQIHPVTITDNLIIFNPHHCPSEIAPAVGQKNFMVDQGGGKKHGEDHIKGHSARQ